MAIVNSFLYVYQRVNDGWVPVDFDKPTRGDDARDVGINWSGSREWHAKTFIYSVPNLCNVLKH